MGWKGRRGLHGSGLHRLVRRAFSAHGRRRKHTAPPHSSVHTHRPPYDTNHALTGISQQQRKQQQPAPSQPALRALLFCCRLCFFAAFFSAFSFSPLQNRFATSSNYLHDHATNARPLQSANASGQQTITRHCLTTPFFIIFPYCAQILLRLTGLAEISLPYALRSSPYWQWNNSSVDI